MRNKVIICIALLSILVIALAGASLFLPKRSEILPVSTESAASEEVEISAAASETQAAETSSSTSTTVESSAAVETTTETSAAATSAAETTAPQSVCSLSIRCDTILQHMDELTEGKAALIPADGNLLTLTDIPFEEGDTVFDVLREAVTSRNLHMEYSGGAQNAYIEGLMGIYAFDCGAASGWMYSVNGASTGVSCGQVTVQPGDVIQFVYSCDLGADVGLQP